MKKKIISIVLVAIMLFAVPVGANAVTVSGTTTISSSTTWTDLNNITTTGKLIVNKGVTLTIDADAVLDNRGTIENRGTIVGIITNNNGTVKNYGTITGAVNNYGANAVYEHAVTIKTCSVGALTIASETDSRYIPMPGADGYIVRAFDSLRSATPGYLGEARFDMGKYDEFCTNANAPAPHSDANHTIMVKNGGSFSFTMLCDDISVDPAKFYARANGALLPFANGVFYMENITNAIAITHDTYNPGNMKKEIKIKLPQDLEKDTQVLTFRVLGYTTGNDKMDMSDISTWAENEIIVKHGDYLYIKVDLDMTVDRSSYAVYVGKKKAEPFNDGLYRIGPVTDYGAFADEFEINVVGVQPNTINDIFNTIFMVFQNFIDIFKGLLVFMQSFIENTGG